MLFRSALITGCGGDVAISLARIARESGAIPYLVGCDIHEDHAGSAFFDSCAVFLRADDPNYLARLAELVRRYRVGVIIPASDAELLVLSRAGALESFEGVPVVAANALAVSTGLDKLATHDLLAKHAIPVPWARAADSEQPLAIPCIVKPRRGQGSKGVRIVSNDVEASKAAQAGDDLIWQELLLPENEEYTCGLFRSRSGESRTIIMRRRLHGGLTGAAVVVDSKDIETYLLRVAQAVELVGAINVQLRLTKDGPKAFEINPRFSSTVLFRHKLGFQDFIWSLRDKLNQAIGPYNPPNVGTRIYRTSGEVILAPSSTVQTESATAI